MQSFLPAQKSTQQSVNFDLKKQNRETMSACITWTICDKKKQQQHVLMMHIFPMILKFPFSQVKISLLIFAMRSLQFSLTYLMYSSFPTEVKQFFSTFLFTPKPHCLSLYSFICKPLNREKALNISSA